MWEQNVPKVGMKCSQGGNKQRAVSWMLIVGKRIANPLLLQHGADGGLEEVYEEIAVIDQEVGGEGEDWEL